MNVYIETLKLCDAHANRLKWAMNKLAGKLPFTASGMNSLSDMDIAILDQFTMRFSKLQDMMGVKLFPLVLELTKEQGELKSFIDKLNRLEQIGAIVSVQDWLILREMRNAFSHEYPEDSDIQAAMLNQAFALAGKLLTVLGDVKKFSDRYSHSSIKSPSPPSACIGGCIGDPLDSRSTLSRE